MASPGLPLVRTESARTRSEVQVASAQMSNRTPSLPLPVFCARKAITGLSFAPISTELVSTRRKGKPQVRFVDTASHRASAQMARPTSVVLFRIAP